MPEYKKDDPILHHHYVVVGSAVYTDSGNRVESGTIVCYGPKGNFYDRDYNPLGMIDPKHIAHLPWKKPNPFLDYNLAIESARSELHDGFSSKGHLRREVLSVFIKKCQDVGAPATRILMEIQNVLEAKSTDGGSVIPV
jgi:hypothetical protein